MISKRGYVLLGLLAVLSVALLMGESGPKTGVIYTFEPVATTPTPPVGGETIVRADPEKLVPVIRANMAGSPSAVRLAQVASEFATAEGLGFKSLPDPGTVVVIADIALSPDANLTLDRIGSDGQTRLALSVRDKAMGEVPALRPAFDRFVAKLRAAFPENAITEVD